MSAALKQQWINEQYGIDYSGWDRGHRLRPKLYLQLRNDRKIARDFDFAHWLLLF
jgi:hypothetical protein